MKLSLWKSLALAAVGMSMVVCTSLSPLAEAADDEVLEINMMLPLYEALPDMNNTWWTMYQEKANVKLNIEWVPSADYNNKMDIVISSGDIPEVCVAWMRPTVYKAYQRGQFWALNDFFGDWSRYPNLKNNMPDNAWDMLSIDGVNYGVPRSRPHVDLSYLIRKDWYDAAGIAVPTTVEEFRDSIAEIMKMDPDGNGIDDTIGLAGYNYSFFTTFMAAFGALDDYFNEDGGLVYYKLTDNYADYVEYVRSLYEAGVLPKEYLSMNGTQNTEIFNSGMAVAMIDNYWHSWPNTQIINQIQPGAEVINLDSLIGPAGDHTFINTGLASGELVIASSVPEEKVYKILDYFERTSTEEFLDIVYYGFPGVHHNDHVMTELGLKEVTMSPQQPLALHKNEWAKVISPAAPPEYNEALIEQSAHAYEVGKYDKFTLLVSESWADTWPRFSDEFDAMEAKAVTGEITMDEFRSYVTELREDEELKKCFAEFAKSNEEKFSWQYE